MHIQNQEMKVTLDPGFPRVFEYLCLAGGQQMLGAESGGRPCVELNGETYSQSDFAVESVALGQSAQYSITFPSLALALKLEFALEGFDLVMRLLDVGEEGGFRLETLYFPDQALARVMESEPGASIYRQEIKREKYHPFAHDNAADGKFSDYIYGRWYHLTTKENAVTAPLKNMEADAGPVMANWAAAYNGKVCATIRNNIGYKRVCTKLLGYDGLATGYALWNNAYHYRLRGKVQPLFEARVGILAEDLNGDGQVDWIEAALWHRRFLPDLNPLYKDAVVSKIICAWYPFSKDNPFDSKSYRPTAPVCTFEECLEHVRVFHEVTGGAPLVFYLVGWQYDGHDTGYPSMDKVNELLGGREKLAWLVDEAKKYNCTISYHINIDDSHEANPGFEESLPSLCLGRDGAQYLWSWYGPGTPKIYRISHTKELETGYFHKRMQAFLDAVPAMNTVHLDTFRYSNESFGPDGKIGDEEEVAACREITRWFNERGIDVTNEGVYDGFWGDQTWLGHLLPGLLDEFALIMIHGKIWGDLKGDVTPAAEVLGYPDQLESLSVNADFTRKEIDRDTLHDSYYLYLLLYHYLRDKELRFIGYEGGDYVARFADGCESRWTEEKTLLVTDGELVIAKDKDRFIPAGGREIRMYSVTGGARSWMLPKDWHGGQAELFCLVDGKRIPAMDFSVNDGFISLDMAPRRPYILVLI